MRQVVGVLISVLLIFAVLLTLGVIGRVMDIEQRCLTLGWPHSRSDLYLKAYCVKIIDGTEVVRPLADIEAGK